MSNIFSCGLLVVYNERFHPPPVAASAPYCVCICFIASHICQNCAGNPENLSQKPKKAMKSKYNRLSRLTQIVIALAATGALISSAYAATYTWTSVGGNWSDSSQWDSNGVPTNDGTADIVFQSPPTFGWDTVNPAALTPSTNIWSVNSLTAVPSDSGINLNAASGASLAIGAGGITINTGNDPYYSLPIIATASQSWYVDSNCVVDFITSGTDINSVTLNNGVNVTKTGNGTLNFDSGSTTTVGTGQFTLDGGSIIFYGTGQYNRLGTNPLGVTANPSSQRPLLDFVDSASGTFASGLAITGGLVNSNITIGWANGQTDAGTTLTVTGPLSGALNGGWTNGTGFITPQMWSAPSSDDRYSIIFQGDGSGLSSTNSADPFDYGILHIASGVDILDNANALGTSNSLSVFVGRNDNRVTNSYVGLLATNNAGIVSAPIKVRQAENGSQHYHRGVEL